MKRQPPVTVARETDNAYVKWLCKWRARFVTPRLRVPQLKASIQEFIDAHQADRKPFVWTKTAGEILASIARFARRTVDARAA